MARYVSIWFRYLRTDWFSIRSPHLHSLPLVLRTPLHGRMIITAVNAIAESKGIQPGMPLADARAIIPDLQVVDDRPDVFQKVLTRLAEWCIRFTPVVGVDSPDGLLLEVSGCTHLWGGDLPYADEIKRKLNARGYHVRVAMADTIGTAWGVARFGIDGFVVEKGKDIQALMPLPPEALRVESEAVERLHKLGLHHIRQFINMPRATLRKRLGIHFLEQIDKALGQHIETLEPVQPIEPYYERLVCLEPIVTRTGIEIALQELLQKLCTRLQQEQKGIRKANFKAYRVDGKTERVSIGTHKASHNVRHLFKLFEKKMDAIEPALGIELFVIEASVVENDLPVQEKMWSYVSALEDTRISELLDRLLNKNNVQSIHRYLPAEHYWPERSLQSTSSIHKKPVTQWRIDQPRPLQLLANPEPIEVTAPIPDYPPIVFRYQGHVHRITKADGPERIEQEWWLQQGQHRDYYRVEDEEGRRYWVFRLGHYHDKTYRWFLHGFFA